MEQKLQHGEHCACDLCSDASLFDVRNYKPYSENLEGEIEPEIMIFGNQKEEDARKLLAEEHKKEIKKALDNKLKERIQKRRADPKKPEVVTLSNQTKEEVEKLLKIAKNQEKENNFTDAEHEEPNLTYNDGIPYTRRIYAHPDEPPRKTNPDPITCKLSLDWRRLAGLSEETKEELEEKCEIKELIEKKICEAYPNMAISWNGACWDYCMTINNLKTNFKLNVLKSSVESLKRIVNDKIAKETIAQLVLDSLKSIFG